MNHFQKIEHGITQQPDIVEGNRGSFVIIGSHDHGVQIPQVAIPKLFEVLDGVAALKMEGEGMEQAFQRFHPLSAEVLARVSVDPAHFFWISESDGENLGQKLLRYDVSERIMEIFVPSLSMRWHGGIPYGFFESLPRIYEGYKSRFGFLDAECAAERFRAVANFWERSGLDVKDLMDFSYDFEMFMGSVREHEYWRPDLRRFRENYSGRIAVCCGVYHVPFVQSVLEGRELVKPDWGNHLDINTDPFVVKRRNQLKEIYGNIETALSGDPI